MFEQSKAAKRRFFDGKFHSRYFVGAGIDIGAGNDSLETVKSQFRGITSIRSWDMPDGDAQYLATIKDNTFDFAHSSHCLEHMHYPAEALNNWIRVVRPNGYVIVTIPDMMMYEHGHWPSRFNDDHKWMFTNTETTHEKCICITNFISEFTDKTYLEKIEVINSFYNEQLPDDIDQTMMINPECCIEFILRKK
jgi:SAM-dependent methyltransferase